MRFFLSRAIVTLLRRWSPRVIIVLAGIWLGSEALTRFRGEDALREATATAAPAVALAAASTAIDEPIARLEIPRLAVSVTVVESIDEQSRRHVAGHIAGTSLPGQPGNMGISGDCDTFFRPLQNLRKNDLITIATARGDYRYRVVYARAAGPGEGVASGASPLEVLTLVTGDPLTAPGPVSKRWIVRAERIPANEREIPHETRL